MSRQPELFEAIHWWLPILLHNLKERGHVLPMTQLITVLNTGTMVDTDGSYSTPQVVIVAMISSLPVFRSFAKDVSNAVTTTSFAMLTRRNTIMGADAFTLPTNLFRSFTSATVRSSFGFWTVSLTRMQAVVISGSLANGLVPAAWRTLCSARLGFATSVPTSVPTYPRACIPSGGVSFHTRPMSSTSSGLFRSPQPSRSK